MHSNYEISEELRDLSSVVAGISRTTPYEAPQGYFEDLPGRISARVLPRNTPFSVPTGYFEGFSSRLMERIKQQEGESSAELTEITSPLLDNIGKKMPFQVPEGYFSDLAQNLASGLPASIVQEEEKLSPLMYGLREKQVYTLPEGYFDAFPATVLSAVIKPAKIIPLNRRQRWLRYAVAAVATGLLVTGGWLRLHGPVKKTSVNPDITQGLAVVSDQEIQSYIDNHNSQIQEQDEDDLANSTASLDITDNDVKSFLGDVSDNELSDYLAEHGSPKDLPTN